MDGSPHIFSLLEKWDTKGSSPTDFPPSFTVPIFPSEYQIIYHISANYNMNFWVQDVALLIVFFMSAVFHEVSLVVLIL